MTVLLLAPATSPPPPPEYAPLCGNRVKLHPPFGGNRCIYAAGAPFRDPVWRKCRKPGKPRNGHLIPALGPSPGTRYAIDFKIIFYRSVEKPRKTAGSPSSIL